jgi:hypothetical protein
MKRKDLEIGGVYTLTSGTFIRVLDLGTASPKRGWATTARVERDHRGDLVLSRTAVLEDGSVHDIPVGLRRDVVAQGILVAHLGTDDEHRGYAVVQARDIWGRREDTQRELKRRLRESVRAHEATLRRRRSLVEAYTRMFAANAADVVDPTWPSDPCWPVAFVDGSWRSLEQRMLDRLWGAGVDMTGLTDEDFMGPDTEDEEVESA